MSVKISGVTRVTAGRPVYWVPHWYWPGVGGNGSPVLTDLFATSLQGQSCTRRSPVGRHAVPRALAVHPTVRACPLHPLHPSCPTVPRRPHCTTAIGRSVLCTYHDGTLLPSQPSCPRRSHCTTAIGRSVLCTYHDGTLLPSQPPCPRRSCATAIGRSVLCTYHDGALLPSQPPCPRRSCATAIGRSVLVLRSACCHHALDTMPASLPAATSGLRLVLPATAIARLGRACRPTPQFTAPAVRRQRLSGVRPT